MPAHCFLLEDVLDGEEQILGSFLNFGHEDLPLVVFFLVEGEVGFEVPLVLEGNDFRVLEPGMIYLNIVLLIFCALRVAHKLLIFISIIHHVKSFNKMVSNQMESCGEKDIVKQL